MRQRKDLRNWDIFPSKILVPLLILTLLLILFGAWIDKAHAEDQICFDPPTAGTMVVELEKARIIEKENDLLRQGNDELERQIGLLKQVIDLKDKQIDVLEKTNKEYENLLNTQKDLYGEMLKQAKPSFFKKLGDMIGAFGLGVVAAGAIILL